MMHVSVFYEFDLAEELFEKHKAGEGQCVPAEKNDSTGRTPIMKPVPTRLITVPREYKTAHKTSDKIKRKENN
jgi:hypothetical protein